MRQQDILELLQKVNENISLIEHEIKKASQNETIKEIFKAKIKASLEHLRSCLEYCAQDIYDIIIKPTLNPTDKDKAIYFPYGKTQEIFYSSICKNHFKQLPDINNDIYQLLESIQPYKSHSEWLTNLCIFTNLNKHNKLQRQDRSDSKNLIIENINIAKIAKGAKGKMSFKNCYFNGKKINHLIISDSACTVDNPSKVKVEFIKWADFTFVDTNINILSFLKDSHSNIMRFQSDFYKLLYKSV